MSGPAERRKIFVHIGTHKTGTTTFQHWLRLNENTLTDRYGLGVYRGAFPNCREVGLACASPDRALPTRRLSQWVDPEWRNHVAGLVAIQLTRPQDLVLSCEALSFLRTEDEVVRLAAMLTDRDVQIVATLRNPDDFLRSWTTHLERDRYRLSDDPKSFAYVEQDSWLVDYESLLTPFRRVFGHDRVAVIDYDAAMTEHSSIVPALMTRIVGDISDLPSFDDVRRNTAAQAQLDRADPARKWWRKAGRFVRNPIRSTRSIVSRWLVERKW